MGGMKWHHFVIWNVLGGITWSSLFTLLGYFFGGVPFVQEHFELVLVLIIAISAVPAAIGVVKGWQAKRRKDKAVANGAGAAAGVAGFGGSGSAFAQVDACDDDDEDDAPAGRHFAR